MTRVVCLLTALTLAACGGGSSVPRSADGSSSVSSAAVPPSAVVLADHETPDLAAQLLSVPGYTWVDPRSGEIEETLDLLHEMEQEMGVEDFFAGVSTHGVVADDPAENRTRTITGEYEVGYLMLLADRYAPPAGLEVDADFFAAQLGPTFRLIGHRSYSDVTVYEFEDPASVDSRYFYLWLRHGVMAQFDGADEASMERWLETYFALPVLSPGETEDLAAFLVPLPGLAYSNGSGLTQMTDVVRAVYGDAAMSVHKIVDREGSVGSLVLIEGPDVQTAREASDALIAAIGQPIDAGRDADVYSVPVVVHTALDGEMVVWTWTWGHVVAMLGVDPSAGADTIVATLIEGWVEADLVPV